MSLILPTLLCVALTSVLYWAEKHTQLQKLPYWASQILIGLLFGGLCVFSSENGIVYDDMIVNVRDAAPICAGLIFGVPAGILSGVIGGLYRFFFAVGDYTRLASSLVTVLIGLVAALLRKLMFDDKKPTWAYGVGIACVCQDIHMLMIFLLNLNDATTAFHFVQRSTIPMVIGNALAVGLSLLAVTFLSKEQCYKREKSQNIAETFQRWLLVCVFVAYFLTSLFTYRLQNNVSDTETERVLTQTIQDISQDILDTADAHLLEVTRRIEKDYMEGSNWNSKSLARLSQFHDVAGINIIGSDGVITASSNPDFVGYDMRGGEQSAEFMCLLEGETQYVQKYQPVSYDAAISRKYAGILLADGTVLQAGYSYEQYKKDIDDLVFNATKNRHIGKSGYIMIVDEDGLVVADGLEHDGMNIHNMGIQIDRTTMQENTIYKAEIQKIPCLYAYLFSEGYCIIGVIPEAEANYMRDISIYVSILLQIVIFAALFIMLYFLVKRVIINNLHKINESLSQITNGNLNVKVDVRSSEEFSSLSDDINSTVTTLKRYIAEAASRIDKELEYAKQIQYSALPSTFPPYPNQDRFDIYAQMIPAKEVGGDFYDFYLLDENTVAFLVADVSGKGIPASLFMMTAKTTIKDLAERRIPVNEVLTEANAKLCEGNDTGMFVTCVMGILDLRTGNLQFANAGHNPPLIRHKDGSFTYLRMKSGFVLAGMEGVRYRLNEYTLHPSDRIFLYTDGVTEATNVQSELYGEGRLQQFLNDNANVCAKNLLHGLKDNIDLFVGEAPQFDDITMLMFDYYGGNAMDEERIFPATIEALPDVQGFFEAELEKVDCSMKTQIAIGIAIEEVFVNVAHYAYPDGVGTATAGFAFDKESRTATFQIRDRGVPFDPLTKEDPDITLSAEERDIGGLGIFITRKTMDSVTYNYQNDENILTMKKII